MPIMKIDKTRKPYYWSEAISHLSKHDPILSNLITKHKTCEALKSTNNSFVTFFKIIVGQQISIEAANAIEGNIKKAIGKVTRKKILSVDTDILRTCGLSLRKTKYIKGIAELVDKDPNYFKKISNLNDCKAIENLTSLYGIGPWSAEMFLIFHFNRKNILPLGDIGLVNSFCKNYRVDKKNFIKEICIHKQSWEPYCTVATWFLWRDIDEDVVQY